MNNCWTYRSTPRYRFTPRGIFVSLAVGCLLTQVGLGFAHAQVGDFIEPTPLLDTEGVEHPFIGEAEVNVFIIFRPDKKHSRLTLISISEVCKRWSNESVTWTAILSDRFLLSSAEEVFEEADLDIKILIDEDDELLGHLGVALYPVIGITDKNHVLRHYLPFRKVNFPAILDAAIKEVLGQIDRTAFEEIVQNPSPNEYKPSLRRKGARLGLARRLIDKDRLVEARSNVLKHLEEWPEDARAKTALESVDALIAHQEEPLEEAPEEAQEEVPEEAPEQSED